MANLNLIDPIDKKKKEKQRGITVRSWSYGKQRQAIRGSIPGGQGVHPSPLWEEEFENVPRGHGTK